jgi:hypothetical protein
MDRDAQFNVQTDDRSTPWVAPESATFQLDYATWHARLAGSTRRSAPVDSTRSPMYPLDLVTRRARLAGDDGKAA